MNWVVYLVVVMIIKVQGVIISDYMTRNPLYDDRATLGTNIISSLKFPSRLSCASYCTRNQMCKSLLYNTNTRYCQLLSIKMNAVSDNGSQTSTGWRYYERKIDEVTTGTNDDMTTAVAATTQFTFDCSAWHHFMGHWYKWDPTPRKFDDAKTFCANLSPASYVIEVQSQAETDWLIALTTTHCETSNEYWLNGYDSNNSESFMWINSQTMTTYTNWYTGEPSDLAEDCVAASTGYSGVWNDIYCVDLRPVVCERNT